MSESTDDIQRKELEQQEETKYMSDVARLEKEYLKKQNLLKEHQDDAHTSMLLLLGAEAMNNVSQESLDFIANITANVQSSLTPIMNDFDKRNLLPKFITSRPVSESGLRLSKSFIASVYISHEGHAFKKSVSGSLDQTADELITLVLTKVKGQHAAFDKIPMEANYWVLKARGSAQYIYGDVPLSNFEFIANAMLKAQTGVELLLLETSYMISGRASQLVDVELSNVKIVEHRLKEGSIFDHSAICIEKNSPMDMKVISMWDLRKPLRVKVRTLSALDFKDIASALSDSSDPVDMHMTAELIHGMTTLTKKRKTRSLLYNASDIFLLWNQYLTFNDIRICDLPKETILKLTLYIEQKKTVVPYAQLRIPIVDYKNIMKSGLVSLKMWKISILNGDELRSTSAAVGDAAACLVALEFDTYCLPVVYPSECSADFPEVFERAYDEYEKKMKKSLPSDIDVNKLVETDTLYELSTEEKFAIWNARDQLVNNPKALSKFLSSIPYKYPKARKIGIEYLQKWKEPPVYDSLELLDFSYADTQVREYAVHMLNKLPDDTLNDFLIQICQCMKSEVYHDCPLSRFILERSFRSPYRIGHTVFWCLKSELHVPPLQERLTTVLRAYLNNCPKHCQQLLKQNDFVDKLLSVAIKIKKYSTKVEQQDIMLQLLKELDYEMCLVPLNPRMEVHGINVAKCRVMGSKKRPLFLYLKNADARIDTEVPDVLVIFKAGDDIRQDTLTLQILKIMDFVWKSNPELGDLCLNPYGSVSTGDMCGFIEVVTRSDTIASITKQFGGASAALRKTPLYQWLKSKNHEQLMKSVVRKFIKSCAAYCVFTYALGIGDRHNDNIMLSETGELLHIDFGHFLGNIKTFAGVRRESAPFVFTKAYCHVICSDAEKHDPAKSANFSTFQKLCFKAFQELRTNGNLFMVLLKLMCNSGIPELRTPNDILYLRNTLVPQIKDNDMVFKYMCELITSSLSDKRTVFNEFWHIFANEHIIK